MRFYVNVIVTLIFLCCALESQAQPSPDTLWTHFYGGMDADWGTSVKQTPDSGFVMVGTTESFGAGEQDMYIVRTNLWGDTLWTHTFGGTLGDFANAVRLTWDGGYALAGVTYSTQVTGSDVSLVRLDDAGGTLWISNLDFDLYEGVVDMDTTVDGGFILTGWSSGRDVETVNLIKVDRDGQAEWSTTFPYLWGSIGRSVRQTADGGFIVSAQFGESDSAGQNICLLKTDAQGDTQWTRTYGTNGEYIEKIQLTADGGYILAGSTRVNFQGSMYLIKIDAAGDTLWTRAYTQFLVAHAVVQTPDGGYLLVGDGVGPRGSTDIAVLKTDSNGEVIWSQTYGGPLEDSGHDVVLTADGGAAVIGEWGMSFTSQSNFYLIRLASAVSPVRGQITLAPVAFSLSNYPNPFNATTTLRYSLDHTGPMDLVIYNLLGEKTETLLSGVREAGAHSIVWNAENYPSGIYFARLQAGSAVQTARLMLTK